MKKLKVAFLLVVALTMIGQELYYWSELAQK